MALIVLIKNISNNPLPSYATPHSAGLDLAAYTPTPVCIHPLERIAMPTGIYLEIPIGYEGQIRSRSGLALHEGIICLNSPGTIDADYRGELKVLLVNLSAKPYTIHNGDRIAQLIIQKLPTIEWLPTTDITTTVRQDGGFGHSDPR